MCASATASPLSDTVGDVAAALQKRLLGRCSPCPAGGRARRARKSDQSTSAILRNAGAGRGPVFLLVDLLATNCRDPVVSSLHALLDLGLHCPGHRRAVADSCGRAPCSSLVVPGDVAAVLVVPCLRPG